MTTVAADLELHVASGLPGFPDVRTFRLTPWGGDGSPFLVLEHVGAPPVAFIAVPPAVFFPDYRPQLRARDRERIGSPADEDLLWLVLVTAPGRAEDATANLLGPLLVNRRTGECAQVALEDGRWSTRVPLLRCSAG